MGANTVYFISKFVYLTIFFVYDEDRIHVGSFAAHILTVGLFRGIVAVATQNATLGCFVKASF